MPPLFSPVMFFDSDARRDRLLQTAVTSLQQIFGTANEPGADLFVGDNLVVIRHQLSFFDDPALLAAIDAFLDVSPHLDARHRNGLLNRIWRFYTLCSLARNCLTLPGCFAEFGVFIGESAFVLNRLLRPGDAGKPYYLFDIFDPSGITAAHNVSSFHGPNLAAEVTGLFAAEPHVRVIPGRLPQTMSAIGDEPIAFAHIDLNNGPAEAAVAAEVYGRMPNGGVILFDDYGWAAYADSRQALDAQFRAQGRAITALPTGQGLLIKS